mmetsp:Transcript_12844/g.41249  ORF Transcript_12844/g.41249 Transcript_12844/m.41249 type:complete len:238 (+) Transcript_12844:482-1195(+)
MPMPPKRMRRKFASSARWRSPSDPRSPRKSWSPFAPPSPSARRSRAPLPRRRRPRRPPLWRRRTWPKPGASSAARARAGISRARTSRGLCSQPGQPQPRLATRRPLRRSSLTSCWAHRPPKPSSSGRSSRTPRCSVHRPLTRLARWSRRPWPRASAAPPFKSSRLCSTRCRPTLAPPSAWRRAPSATSPSSPAPWISPLSLICLSGASPSLAAPRSMWRRQPRSPRALTCARPLPRD